MDTRLRELERQALNDPDAKLRWVEEKKRLGYREVQHFITSVYMSSQYNVDDFPLMIQQAITAARMPKSIFGIKTPKGRIWKDICHKFYIEFQGESTSCCGSVDCYCDNSVDVSCSIYGYSLETDVQKIAREKQEATLKKQAKQQMAKRAKARRDAQKAAQEEAEKRDLEIYLKLKKQFEDKAKVESLIEAIGEEAANKLSEYTPSYYKSWFWRKSKKLSGRTPIEIYDAGEIELLKNFALKLL